MLRISPGLRRCWRDVGRVQLGGDPALARIVEGLTPGDEALLEDLVDGVAETDLLTRAASRGLGAGEALHLVRLLRDAGVLERASAPGARAQALASSAEARTQQLVRGAGGWDVLARRAQRRVLVEGRGDLPSVVAAGLEEAGVGRVRCLLPGVAAATGADGASSLGATAARRPGTSDARGPVPGPAARAAGRADLVVLVAEGAAPPARAAQLLRADADHLVVVLRERSAVVGPLVVPGAGPCLRCLDLHRADRDPEWPLVAAQLAHPATGDAAADVVLVRLVTALAVAQALAHLDAPPGTGPAPASRGRTWEVGLPDGLPVGRAWSPHPSCGCTWPPP